jgi:hypothetical protein
MVTQHSAYIHHPWMRSPPSDKILIVSVASMPVRPLPVTAMNLLCSEEVPRFLALPLSYKARGPPSLTWKAIRPFSSPSGPLL